jgi:tetratricopeptide (TPR) repeat protein
MEFESGHICPACKVDVPLFSKTVHISDSLYNAGLARAKSADMTGAIESLKKSLTLNKNNVAARNLIGLIYFEIGKTGDALKEWRISASLIVEENPAVQYIQQMQKNIRQMEKLNDAVHMYNMAFDYIRQKSDDMAIIQLKKAIELNPKFIDALNLLSLCYLMQGDNDKAVGVIEKILTLDVNNAIALQYYRQILPGKTRPELGRSAKKAAVAPAVRLLPGAPSWFGRSFPVAGIIAFILGGLSAFAVLYILILPERIAAKDLEIEKLQNDRVAQVQLLREQFDSADAELKELRDSEKALNDENEVLRAQIELNDRINRIVDAERRVDRQEYQEAVDAAASISADGLPSDLLERLQNIRNEAYPQLTKKYYNDGVRLYNSRQYDESRLEFENAMRYMRSEDDLGDDVLYYLGRIAVLANDLDGARVYFQRVLDEYPDGNQISNARSRLNSLG